MWSVKEYEQKEKEHDLMLEKRSLDFILDKCAITLARFDLELNLIMSDIYLSTSDTQKERLKKAIRRSLLDVNIKLNPLGWIVKEHWIDKLWVWGNTVEFPLKISKIKK